MTERTMKMDHPIGAIVGMIASGWASVTFLRGSISGAPPLYSKGWPNRTLHFAAGIIFALLLVIIGVMLVRK
jgi:hypothetical protein